MSLSPGIVVFYSYCSGSAGCINDKLVTGTPARRNTLSVVRYKSQPAARILPWRCGGSMPGQGNDRKRIICALDEVLVDTAGYLRDVNPDLDGGHQTAREVLCHLVFWHREYVTISRSLLEGQEPPLREGTYAQLNAQATREFCGRSMADMACLLLTLQESLRQLLLAMPDWSIDFPVKQDSRTKSVAERVPAIEDHLRDHVRRLRRAGRLGEAWVKAYYPDHE